MADLGTRAEQTRLLISAIRHRVIFVQLANIPVCGEHVCTQCGGAVHAWCSNHEDITSSADLICNFCSSI